MSEPTQPDFQAIKDLCDRYAATLDNTDVNADNEREDEQCMNERECWETEAMEFLDWLNPGYKTERELAAVKKENEDLRNNNRDLCNIIVDLKERTAALKTLERQVAAHRKKEIAFAGDRSNLCEQITNLENKIDALEGVRVTPPKTTPAAPLEEPALPAP